MEQKINEYVQVAKELKDLKKIISKKSKNLKLLEKDIFNHMKENEIDTISYNDAQIILYNKKISQQFKKEHLLETMGMKLQNEDQAEELVDFLLQNKKFTTEPKIRVKL